MKYLLSVILLFSTLCSFALGQGHFTIKGNVKNFDADFFEFLMTSFMEDEMKSIKVDKEGNFKENIAIEGVQDIYLYLNNDAITISASAGDTLVLNWDHKNFQKTFELSSPNITYRQDLALAKELYEKTRQRMLKLQESLYNKDLTDSVKCLMINNSYNVSMGIIAKHPFKDMKPLYDTYFEHISMLSKIKKLEQFSLKLNVTFDDVRQYGAKGIDYRKMSEEIFKLSPTYREFVFNRVRFYKPFSSYYFTDQEDAYSFNPGKQDFLAGELFIELPSIREWYLTKAIIFGFGHYDFNNSKELYEQFLATYSNSKYVDTLRNYYNAVSRLAPGKPAPQFSLKDQNNKTVSLKDFAGKVVYIDFWGVYCGPCIADIREYGKTVHDKYQSKDVVFLNICVDEKGDRWKDKMKYLEMTGVNLVAERGILYEVCKAYNVSAVPHYVLIGKDGKIINNNAMRLGGLSGSLKNQLDKALE
ncbi:MAG: TlpA disulfide reductase family protein [Pedobacter sp.]